MISCKHIFYQPKKAKFQLLIDTQDFNQEGVTAFLGPNGAGKSTLFKVMAGVERPTTGSANFDGKNVFEDFENIKNDIHLLSWDINPYEDVSVIDLLNMMRSISPIWDTDLEHKLTSEFELPLSRQVAEMSRGQRAKVRLLLSLPRKPKLVMIDEIANELDNDTRKMIYKLLDEYTFEHQAQVFIATNILEDMERYASNVVFMSQGKVLLHGKVDELKEKEGKSLETIYQNVIGIKSKN